MAPRRTTEIARERETAEIRADAAWQRLCRVFDEGRHNSMAERPAAVHEIAEALEWYRSRAAFAEMWKVASEIEGREVHVYGGVPAAEREGET